MNKSDFTVKCPGCGKINNFCNGDDWNDEFLDDSSLTEVVCNFCEHVFMVKSDIDIVLKVDTNE